MSANFTLKGSKELLLVAERMASDKGIPLESIIKAMEDGIRLAARKKYGSELNIECNIDRKTGNISVFNRLEVVEDAMENDPNFDFKTQVGISDAVDRIKKEKAIYQEEVKVGETIKVELPPIDLSRVIAQIAKNEIMRKVKEAEKLREYEEFKDRVGTIANGVVRKTAEGGNLIVEVDGYETLLRRNNLIPGEQFRVDDRIRAYIEDVSQERKDAQVLLSRVSNNFIVELLKQEVPEIYDGLIEIKGVARDPGSKAKVVVYSRDNFADVVGACVGPRGSRVLAVSGELRGEKIDIIKWSEDVGELVSNLLAPAKVSKVNVNEATDTIEVVVAEDQLSLAIGRGGQNIRLASRIMGSRIDILTDDEEKAKRVEEFNEATQLFMNELDVEEVIGQLLAADGYSDIESIAYADVEDLSKIEGFDEDIAGEIKSRAEEWVAENTEALEEEE